MHTAVILVAVAHGSASRASSPAWDTSNDPRFESSICNIDRVPLATMSKQRFERDFEGKRL